MVLNKPHFKKIGKKCVPTNTVITDDKINAMINNHTSKNKTIA
jgi:hypothetical protein